LQVLTLGQAPDREANDVNHTEPELFLQAVNEMKVRVREANSRRLEFSFFMTLKCFIAPGDGLGLPQS
jgi:hypothetical protein